MKKFILSILLPFLYFLTSIFAFPLAQAKASNAIGDYACILSECYFYATRNERRGLFLIPETYFVKILDLADDFCRVEYLYDDDYTKRLVGYVKTSDLTFVDFTPKRPYLYRIFDVTYTIDENVSIESGILDSFTVTCAYYGDYRIGAQTYCYVLRGNEFGYVPKPENLVYDENPEYADYLASQTPPSESVSGTNQNSEKGNPTQIAILIALCLLVPVLAALILKQPNRPPYERDE